MIVEFFGNPMNLWLLGTAILFTLVGRYLFFKDNVSDIVDSTIDSLIEQGYIKLEGNDIVKWEDWCKEND
jgi:hypothetical protein